MSTSQDMAIFVLMMTTTQLITLPLTYAHGVKILAKPLVWLLPSTLENKPTLFLAADMAQSGEGDIFRI